MFFDDGTKTVNYNYNYKTEDVAKIKEVELNRELELNKRQDEKKKNKVALVVALLGIILGLTLMLATPYIFSIPAENKSKAQEQELQNIVNEIYVDIEDGNYELALIKAKSLHYTANWSSRIEEKWDDTRESLIKLIEEKMKK